MRIRTGLAAVLVVFAVSAADAQNPPVRPILPPEEPLEPDRPDVTNGSRIVDTGLLQLEIGGLFTRTSRNEYSFGSPVTARVGIADWIEARIGTDGFLSDVDAGTRSSGIGNVQVGAKLRVWADPGGAPVLSILPNVNLPAANPDKGLGSGDPDYTVAFLTGTDVGERGHVDVNYGIGAIGAGGGLPHFLQHLVSVSASLALDERWNPYFETFWYSKVDSFGGALTAFDFGAVYTLTPRFAIDGGIQLGATRAAPDFAAFGGVSVVVGDVLGEHGVRERQRNAEKRARARAPRH
jgi:hypothetical protein